MGHTPGPWTVWGMSSNDGEAEVVSNADGSKAICWTADTYNEDKDRGETTSEDKANAHLIAAAPELLAVLKDLWGWEDVIEEWDKELHGQMRAAIAKAEGRSE